MKPQRYHCAVITLIVALSLPMLAEPLQPSVLSARPLQPPRASARPLDGEPGPLSPPPQALSSSQREPGMVRNELGCAPGSEVFAQRPALGPPAAGTSGPDAGCPGSRIVAQFAGHMGGSAKAVAVAGDLAYAGVGPTLVVLDVQDPMNPRVLGQSPILPDSVRDVQVQDGIAYAGMGPGGLELLDVSDPRSPTPLGHCPTWVEAVAIARNYAFAAAALGGLNICDVSDPANPTIVGNYGTLGLFAGVHIVDSSAYVADYWGDRLLILDVSDPAAPFPLGSHPTGAPVSVAVSDDIAYVGSNFYGLDVIDCTNPASPRTIGHLDRGVTRDIEVAGDLAYALGYEAFDVIDISDPSSPAPLGTYATGKGLGLDMVGSTAFIADTHVGLQIVDVSAPSEPSLKGLYATCAIRDVHVSAGLAYAATSHGLQILDLGDPAQPQLLGACSTQYAYDVDVAGDRVLLAGEDGVEIIDAADPASPWVVGAYETYGIARGVATAPPALAFVAESEFLGFHGMRILDISQPSAPVLLASHETLAPGVGGVEVMDGMAFLPTSPDGLEIVDASVPAAPARVTVFSYHEPPFTQVSPQDVELAPGLAYVTDRNQGLQIIDVSSPAQPNVLGSLPELYDAEGLFLADGLAFVYTMGYLQIVDVADPSLPRLLETVTIPGYYGGSGIFRDVHVQDNVIVLALGEEGLITMVLQRLDKQLYLPSIAR